MGEGKTAYLIGDMPVKERPRERLELLGPKNLSEAELLAILLRVGMKGESAVQQAQRVLKELNGVNGIYKAPFHDLCRTKGVGKAKAAQIMAALELGQRITAEDYSTKTLLNNPSAVARLVEMEMVTFQQENLWVLVLDTRGRLISVEKIYRGTLYASNVRNAEIFRPAIIKNGASIILIHNHPSGDPTPSTEDISFTHGAIAAGKNLEIDVLDHIVIGGIGNYISLKEKGVNFSNNK